MTHNECIAAAARWAKQHHHIVATEVVSGGSRETPDVIAFQSNRTTVIECKVSRSDFLADRKKFHRNAPEYALGDYRLYCAPKGMIDPSELPLGWGLLEVDEDGRAHAWENPFAWDMHKKYWNVKSVFSERFEAGILYSLLRRSHQSKVILWHKTMPPEPREDPDDVPSR